MFSNGRKGKRIISLGKNSLVMLMCFSLVFSTFTPALMAAETQAQTDMKHSPPKYFVPEHRIQMEAQVKDPSGVELVRCYFRAAGEADFVFVPMTNTRRNNYAGILPAPSPATEQIEYLFLAVNAENEVVKSQTFVIDREERDEAPAWQDIAKEGDIQVSMELDQVPANVPGFSDNIAMNAVESGARFGVVAGGLYQLSSSTSGSAAAASSAGTVSAGAAGIGTAGAVALGVGAAAAVGGAAAAGSSSGGSSSSKKEPITEKTIVGSWELSGHNTTGWTTYGPFTFHENGRTSGTFNNTGPEGSQTQSSAAGKWQMSGTNLTLTFDEGAIYIGEARGDSKSFTISATNNNWTLNFKK